VSPHRADSAAGPERALLQRQYGAYVKQALGDAATGLPARDRTLLRLHLLQGVSLTRLATMYRRDVSTLSRWVDRARTAFGAATREALKARLQVSEPELESIIRAVDLEISVNLSGYFRSSVSG
jgi:RNA polymerase sigma-70 factor (ECF subfamily)